MCSRARGISVDAMIVKFVLCSRSATGEFPWTTRNIEVESEGDDVETASRDDGDTTGGKTRKLVSIMSTYTEKCRDDLLLETDDDACTGARHEAVDIGTAPERIHGRGEQDHKTLS